MYLNPKEQLFHSKNALLVSTSLSDKSKNCDFLVAQSQAQLCGAGKAKIKKEIILYRSSSSLLFPTFFHSTKICYKGMEELLMASPFPRTESKEILEY
jgi:hypothetical protein